MTKPAESCLLKTARLTSACRPRPHWATERENRWHCRRQLNCSLAPTADRSNCRQHCWQKSSTVERH